MGDINTDWEDHESRKYTFKAIVGREENVCRPLPMYREVRQLIPPKKQ